MTGRSPMPGRVTRCLRPGRPGGVTRRDPGGPLREPARLPIPAPASLALPRSGPASHPGRRSPAPAPALKPHSPGGQSQGPQPDRHKKRRRESVTSALPGTVLMEVRQRRRSQEAEARSKNPLAAVIAYLREHSGTVERYDLAWNSCSYGKPPPLVSDQGGLGVKGCRAVSLVADAGSRLVALLSGARPDKPGPGSTRRPGSRRCLRERWRR
jgi:hypothetical protein